MRQILKLLIIALVVLYSCNFSDRIVIEGTITDGAEKELFFKELLVDGVQDIENIKLDKKGNFHFSTKTQIPRFYYLSLSKDNFITLLINPGEKVKISANASDLKKATVKGSPETLKIQLLNNRLEKTKSTLDSLSNLYKSIDQTSTNDLQSAVINQQYINVINRQRDSSIAFILRNMGSMTSIMALYQKIDDENYVLYKNRDLQFIKLVSDSLSRKYPDSPHVKSLLSDKENLLNRYNQIVSQRKIEELAKTKEISGIPDIALPNKNGDTISLNSIHSKYKLLCFWASWSKESIQRNLELINLYEKYHKKGFEIYMVSLDTKEDAWKNAVSFDQLPWINVIDLNGRTSYVAKIYNVRVLPASYLINSADDIVSVNPTKRVIESTLEYALK